MMEDGRGPSSPGSIFGTYPSYGQSGAGSLTGLSPYLNVDPSYLQSGAPEFIRNEVSKSLYYKLNYFRLILLCLSVII